MSAPEILRDIVNINSVFPNEEKLGIYIERHLKGLGFRTLRQNVGGRRFNLFAERGRGRRALLFYGHMDTVPIYGDWKTDPLKLTKDGDRLYGVGTCDMKGGIAAMLEAVRAADRDRYIKLLFCVDEENISVGVREAVKRSRWLSDVFFTVSVEPGDSQRQTGGANVVTVGRRGRVVISVDIEGVSSHGSNPQRGINALEEAAKIALSLKKFDLRRSRGFGSETVFVNTIEGRATSLTVPDKAHMEIDVQLVPPNSIESARKRVQALVRHLYRSGILNPRTIVNVSIKKRETPYINPYVNNINGRRMKNLFSIVRNNIGRVVINYGSSVADDNILFEAMRVPIVTIGPSGGSIHSANEWVSESNLNLITMLYTKLMNEL